MPRAWFKLVAFLKRDLRIESSYKVAFAFQTLGSVVPVFTFYFVARLVDPAANDSLTRYGGAYFPFVLVGLAFSRYFMTAMTTFANTIRRAQATGVFEATLSTRTSPQAVILYTSAYGLLMATVQIGVILLTAWAFLGIDLGNANLPSVCVTMALTMLAFGALGICSAAAIVVLKKGDPIEVVVGWLSTLLGGAYFPVSIMPDWMQAAAWLVPITHALEAMRLAIFQGSTISELMVPLGALSLMAAILLPLGLLLFHQAVDRGRRDGTLVQY